MDLQLWWAEFSGWNLFASVLHLSVIGMETSRQYPVIGNERKLNEIEHRAGVKRRPKAFEFAIQNHEKRR